MNMNNTISNNNINVNLEHNSLDGGEAIASGGFGCVFKPALRCKNGTRPKDKVTKLMSTHHAIKEYEFIQSVKSRLKSIPNYDDYFLVDDFELCEPASLTAEDAKNFEEKCSALKKTSKKSNSKKSNSKKSKNRSRSKMSVYYLKKHLDDVRALNMPDGGVDLEIFLKTNNSKKDLIEINNALIDLLLNGIVSMNKKLIYHCDIKDTNILIEKDEDKDKLNARLIDWGLSVLDLEDNYEKIPSNLNRRPFQYNVPFSSILFNTHFVEMYADFLKKTPSPSETELRNFTMNYILFWNEERGEGHIKTIHRIIGTFVKHDIVKKNDKIKDNHFAYYYIIDYIVKILHFFTRNGVFHIMEYFNNVFMKNIDIWGFIMTYMAFVEELENIDSPFYHHFLKKIKNIVFHFLYDSPTKPMDIQKLIELLKDLNKIDTQQGGTKKIKKRKNKTRKLKKEKNKTRKLKYKKI